MFAIIDTETSGGKYNEESIIELGILIFDGKGVIKTFQSLINPKKKVDYFVQRLTQKFFKILFTIGVTKQILRLF